MCESFDHHYVEIPFSVAKGTQNIAIPGDFAGAQFNAVDALLVADAPTGGGTNPTLDVKLQGSLDEFADDVADVITFTQATAAGHEAKVARRAFTGTVIRFGRQFRANIVVGNDSGATAFTGKLHLLFIRD